MQREALATQAARIDELARTSTELPAALRSLWEEAIGLRGSEFDQHLVRVAAQATEWSGQTLPDVFWIDEFAAVTAEAERSRATNWTAPFLSAIFDRLVGQESDLSSADLRPFRDALDQRLAAHGDRALFRAFQAQRAIVGLDPSALEFEQFVSLSWGAGQFWEQHAALTRLLCGMCVFGAQAVQEICRSAVVLPQRAGFTLEDPIPADPQGPWSDYHHGGRAVWSGRDAFGERWYFKPRSIAAEAAHGLLVTWLRNEFGTPLGAPPRMRQGESDGWVSEVKTRPPESTALAAQICRGIGWLISLLHGFRATDIHPENVAFATDGPVLLDAETLLHPLGPARFLTYESGLRRDWNLSLLRTNALGCSQVAPNGQRHQRLGWFESAEWLGQADGWRLALNL